MVSSLSQPRNRIIVALDVADTQSALKAAAELHDCVGMVKIGLELFVAQGPSVVAEIRKAYPDLGIFLDLKLHDIPNTMQGAIRSAKEWGVQYLTVHAGSGVEHLKGCVQEAGSELGILAVTVLTSQDQQACAEAGHTKSPRELVEIRARAAAQAGCAGLVCSGQELDVVSQAAPSLAKIVPGIRPAGAQVGDQKRVMTPEAAVAAGATYLVIGRPIMRAPDRRAAALAIAESI